MDIIASTRGESLPSQPEPKHSLSSWQGHINVHGLQLRQLVDLMKQAPVYINAQRFQISLVSIYIRPAS